MRYAIARLSVATLILMALLAPSADADWVIDRIGDPNTSCQVAIDAAGLAHAMYQIPGNGYGCNCGTLRSFVRLGPGNIIEISNPSSPIDAVRPSMAVDSQRNHYVVYEKEWAGQTSIIRYNYMGNNTWVREGPYDIPGEHGYSPRIVIGPNGNLHVVTAQGGYTHYSFHSGPNLATGWVGPHDYPLGGWGDAAGIAADNSDAGLLCVEVGPERSGDIRLLRYVNGSLVSDQKVNSGVSPTGYRWPSMATDHGTGQTFIFARGFENGDNMEVWTRSATGVISGPTVIRARPAGKDFDCPIVSTRNGIVRYMWRESPGPSGERFCAWWTNGVAAPQLLLPGTGYTVTPGSMVLDPNGFIYAGMAIWNEAWMGPCIVVQPNPAATGALAGTVRDNLGSVLANVLVEAQTAGHYYQARTNESGVYQMTGVYPGAYSVTGSKLGYQSQTTTGVSISADQTATLDLALPITQGTFTGTVRDQYGAPVQGVSVTAVGPGTYSGEINSSGVYTLSGVSVGNYSITATKFGYIGQTVSGSLSTNGQTTSRDLSIRLLLIADAKSAADWASIELTRKAVTGVFSSDGCIYIEEPDRSGGIRVVTTQAGIAVGDLVDVAGTVGTRTVSNWPSERVINATSVTRVSPGTPLKPPAMGCRAVGGAARPGIPGVKDGVGANNMGMLVKIAGRVTKVLSTYVYIDDGSGVENASGSGPEVGVMVRCPSTPGVAVGNIVSATGVVEGSIPTGWTTNRRYLRLRDAGDLQVLYTGPTTGAISGTVMDSYGAPVVGATVSTNTGGYSTTSGTGGSYMLANVTAGSYSVTASKSGFQPQTLAGVSVQVEQTTTANFALGLIPVEALANGGFEGTFIDFWGGRIGTSWNAAYRNQSSADSTEWMDYAFGGSNGTVQSVYLSLVGGESGIRQTVSALTPGHNFRFSAYAYQSSANSTCWIASDPNGGTALPSRTTSFANTPGQWNYREVTGTVGASGSVSVFLWAWHQSNPPGTCYLDGASLMVW